VSGLAVNIVDGDITPGSNDGTDFGTVLQGTRVDRVFTVSNTGMGTLTPSGLTLPTGFSLVEGLSAAIVSNGSDSFTVRLDGTTAGTKSGQISFTTNDSDENPFNFSIAGAVVIPDLIVGSIVPATTTVTQGTSLAFSYTVKDIGTAGAGASYAAFMIDQKPDPAHWAGWNYTNALAVGESQTFNSSIGTAGLSLGQHTLWFGANAWSSIGEGDETNNWNSFTFDVIAVPDLVVSTVTPAATTVALGASLGFSYTIKDIGTAGAGASYAAFMIDQKPDTTHFTGWNYVGALAVGGSQSFTSDINTGRLSVGQHTLWLGADTWSSVAEGNETNNLNSFTFNVLARA
jgi:subtilase family serine protease